MGTQSPPQKDGGVSGPNFRSMSRPVVAKRLDGSGGGPWSRPHCGRWRPSSPPQKVTEAPDFRPILLWPNGWMHQDATWYGGRPQPRRLCVRWGPSLPSPKGAEPPNFRAMSIVVKRLHGSRCHYVGRPRPTRHCVRCGPSSPPLNGHSLPIFG